MYKYLMRLSSAVISGRFNSENYRLRKAYHGREIQTTPLFCSYGEIGYSVNVYDNGRHEHTLEYDWEQKKLHIDGIRYKDAINLEYLDEKGLLCRCDEPVWQNHPYSVELECYTDAGGDMIIDLEELTKAQLQDYIDNFDIDEEVALWWSNGKPGNGVPFANMREHYNDLEDYLKWLQGICNKMPY